MKTHQSHSALCRQVWLTVALFGGITVAVRASTEEERRDVVERAHQYLFSAQNEGALGDSRRQLVTSLFVLASLSSGYMPDHPKHGAQIQAAYRWVLENSSEAFLGGQEDPNIGHATGTLMLLELLGMVSDAKENLGVAQKANAALEHSLKIQDRGVGKAYYGGWRRNDKTKANDRMLSTWFLYALRSGELCGLPASKNNLSRATEFVTASQVSDRSASAADYGGFSVDAKGLPVRSTTAAGMLTLALFDAENEKALLAARDWLVRHPPRWHGPNFYETNFFATRALYRTRQLDGGKAFDSYFARVARFLKERQQPDGSIPFPPGHGGPILAMGPAYSTAMAILILNVDRGLIPMDK